MIVGIIQARMGSSRLPGKMLKKISGKYLIQHVLDQVKYAKRIDKILLASTISEQDKELHKVVSNLGYDTFAGSEDDLLDRHYQAARKFNAEIIVRITGDCPLIDPGIIDKVIQAFLDNNCDYCSNIHPPTYPDGLDVEVFSFWALEKAWKEAKLKSEREHVTPYIWKNADKFRLVNVRADEDLSNIRITVDEEEDLKLFEKLLSRINKSPIYLEDVLNVIKSEPGLLKINAQFERNEGYQKSLKEDENGN